MDDSKKHRLFSKKPREEQVVDRQKLLERKAALLQYICMELVKRGVEVPPPFDFLVEEEDESDRRCAV